jgi:hypothetical protein
MESKNVVGWAAPSHSTREPGAKFIPTTVRSKPGLPATIDEGYRSVIVGHAVALCVTVNVLPAIVIVPILSVVVKFAATE